MSRNAMYALDQSATVLRGFSWRTVENSAAYIIPYLKPDMVILDVGCGPGTITLDLANRVPNGRVVGVDNTSVPLQSASTLAAQAGITNATFEESDALALPFPDGSFDLVHAHQLLQHVQDPVGVIREMRRVTRPGGLVAVRVMDFESMAWFPDVPGIQDSCAMRLRTAHTKGTESSAGRRLVSWALEAGFTRDSIAATAGTWCYSTVDERRTWSEMIAHILLATPLGISGVEQGLAAQKDLERMAHAWREWETKEDGWFSVLHGEIVCRV
ncbi:S-adenosyl-L-methionine-dependent methyltransferase [Obba rivulosa]|uniref:S-adenosyl-L-methionine-dependent methyltransferase n=1 Tax=Obba rivulosa TaxID=1052685 RepID=A0A8E2AZM4_9APHY|nr:S-adenosyl-L-methionine-dependent methyltransferase [Obba rivulosa]